MEKNTFRILVLDGGGIKGVFTAGVLAQFEKDIGHSVSEHFDLIVGTSTGGIIALGIGLELSPDEILELYRMNAAEIFPSKFFDRNFGRVKHFFGPKHNAEGLAKVLNTKLAGKKLGHSKNRLVISTFDALKGHACTFKTAHHERLAHEYDLSAVDIALATSAAPTYFSSARVQGRSGGSYIDGGVWANSPCLVGIVEAVSFLEQSLDQIKVLSIGTTAEASAFVKRKSAGILGWNKGLIDLMMAAQVSSSQHQAKLLVGDENFLRIDHLTLGGEYSLDDARSHKVEELEEIGRSVARSNQLSRRVADMFLTGQKVKPFMPIYSAS